MLNKTPFAFALAAALSLTPAIAAEKTFVVDIAAGKAGEVCMPLKAGDTLVWRFKSSAAADFNLHHHVGKDVLLPVERKHVREDRAEHAIDRSNDWCLMWTAPAGERIRVQGAWSLKAAAPSK